MVHLDEKQDKYADLGLTVLAITNEPRNLVDKFLEQTKAKHGIIIETGDAAKSFGLVGGYPTVYVIDTEGKIAFAGNWSDDARGLIEELLKTVRLVPELPRQFASIAKAVDEERFGDASKALTRALAKEGLAEDDRSALEQMHEWLAGTGAKALKQAQALLAAGEYAGARRALETTSDGFSAFPAGKEAAKALDELLKDKTLKRELRASEALAKARVKAEGLSSKKAIAVYKNVKNRFRGTKTAEIVDAIIARLEASSGD